MEGLAEYTFERGSLAIRPSISESWTSSKNQAEWTFKLRPSIEWTDGVSASGGGYYQWLGKDF